MERLVRLGLFVMADHTDDLEIYAKSSESTTEL